MGSDFTYLLLLRKETVFRIWPVQYSYNVYGRFFGLKHKIPKKDTAAIG